MTSFQPAPPHDPKLVSFRTPRKLTCADPKFNKKAMFSLDLRSSNVIYIYKRMYRIIKHPFKSSLPEWHGQYWGFLILSKVPPNCTIIPSSLQACFEIAHSSVDFIVCVYIYTYIYIYIYIYIYKDTIIYIKIYIQKLLFLQTSLLISSMWALSPVWLNNFFTSKLTTIVIDESAHFCH